MATIHNWVTFCDLDNFLRNINYCTSSLEWFYSMKKKSGEPFVICLKNNKDNKSNPDSTKAKWDRFAIWLANGSHNGLSMFDTIHFLWHLGPYIFVAYILADVPHIWKPIYTSGLYFPNYISSSVGLVTIELTCSSNNDKKSIKIPEEATLYCRSKKDAANKVKIIFTAVSLL